jgi:hypothetical protein
MRKIQVKRNQTIKQSILEVGLNIFFYYLIAIACHKFSEYLKEERRIARENDPGVTETLCVLLSQTIFVMVGIYIFTVILYAILFIIFKILSNF